MQTDSYPLTLQADTRPDPSRWLWIVKFILVIPHVIVLAFLWIAYCLMTIIAFFAILFTAHYPPSIFKFNVGVLRWAWRVGYYSFAANGTDRYPPFTLEDVADYPAHLDVTYPERLSRGLVLVKWWLLAIPHLIIVAIFSGGVWYAYSSTSDTMAPVGGGGLIGILLLVSVVILLFTGKYPQSLYDFILGMDRWVFRVAAYVGLMTDEYPPFRLDMGGAETGTSPSPDATMPPAPGTPIPDQPDVTPTGGWTGGRVAALVAGCVLALVAAAMLFGGGVALWADQTQRDADGFLSTPTNHYTTSASALTTSSVDMSSAPDWVPELTLGDVRIDVEPIAPGSPVFVGIGPTSAVDTYLAGVSRATIEDPYTDSMDMVSGGAASPPGDQDFWVASTTGEGMQSLPWNATGGSWTVVAMNPDGHEGLDVTISAAATIPALDWISILLLAVGLVFLIGGTLLIVLGVSR